MELGSDIAEHGTFTLYSAAGSRGVRVEKLLELMGVSYELVRVSLGRKEHKAPAYLKDIHPLGLVPALKHGEKVLVESGAIMLYLADLFPNKKMCPAIGTMERGLYYEWFMFTLASMEPLMANVIDKGQCRLKSEQKLQDVLKAVDSRIGSPYLLGERLSAADVLVHNEIHWIRKYFRGIDFSELGRINEYYDRLMTRLDWS